jgi:hypothetical protein
VRINNRQNGSASSVEFDQLCQEILSLSDVGEVSAAAKDRLIEDLRLRCEYPGEYVAYVDNYKTVNKLRRLNRRLVAHSTDLAEIQRSIQRHSQRERARVTLEYVEPLGEEFNVPHELPFR